MKIPDEQLSAHFRLSEFVRSETASRYEIDNTPPPAVIERLRNNAGGMEQVRARLGGASIHVSSGYRCPELERATVGPAYPRWCAKHGLPVDEASWLEYLKGKAHPRGDATDCEAPAFGTPYAICRELEGSDIAFDQLIWEHTWVHVGWAREGELPRRQVLTLEPGGNYALGLVEHAAT